MNAITIEHLSKSFDNKTFVLDDLSFSVPQGKITAFIGANGSGKTTTLHCILNFLRYEKGGIHFFDKEKFSLEVQARVGYLPEQPLFYSFLTSGEFLTLHARLARVYRGKDQIEEVLHRVGLESLYKKRIHTFSKGMLQRLGLAQAIIHQPKLLILDEPMSGLDPDGRWELKNLIKEIHQQGASVFFSSHLLFDAEEICENIVIIKKGRLMHAGPNEKNLETMYKELSKR